MKRIFFSIAVTIGLVASLIAMPAAAYDRDSDEVNDSITDGVAWLANQQHGDGSWGGFERVGSTGLVLTKLLGGQRAKNSTL